MSQTLIRLDPAQDAILARLQKSGLYKTKSEALRAGVFALGREQGYFKTARDLEDFLVVIKADQIMAEIKSGKRKTHTFEEVKKKYGYK